MIACKIPEVEISKVRFVEILSKAMIMQLVAKLLVVIYFMPAQILLSFYSVTSRMKKNASHQKSLKCSKA